MNEILMKCNKYGPPPSGTTALALCNCAACAIPTKRDEDKLREQVTRGLFYIQSLKNNGKIK
jgi:hypothetical protein